MALPPIVQVDAKGVDAEGNDVNWHARADKVRDGLMVNVKVLAQYPNGEIRDGNIVRITPKGLAQIAKEMSAGTA